MRRRCAKTSATIPTVWSTMVFGPARQFWASMDQGPLELPSTKTFRLIGSALSQPAKNRVPHSIPMAMKKKANPSR